MRFRIPRHATWPLLLLIVSIGTTAAIATHAYNLAREQDRVLRHVTTDYSRFASWSYEQHLQESLRNTAREILGPVDHGAGLHESSEYPHASELEHYLPWNDSCSCHMPEHGPVPDALIAWTLGSDTVGIGTIRRYETQMHESEMPVMAQMPSRSSAHGFAWVNDTVTAHMRARIPSQTGSPYIVAIHEGEPRLIVYRPMPTAWGDTIMYVAQYGAGALADMLGSVMDVQDLLPPALTSRFTSRELLRIEVTTHSGAAVFRSDSAGADVQSASASRMPADFGSLEVSAQVHPSVASTLVIGGAPRSQLPLLLGLFVLASAMAVIAAGQLAREGRLARDRTNFVASVSHELRTPLANVRLFLETMLHGRADTEDARRWSLEQMDRETRRLTHLIDNVLVYSSGPTRLLDEPRMRVDLASEVTAVIQEFTPLSATRRARIETRLEPDVHIAIPKRALRHVLLNLLDNAVKYGPMGQTVSVRTWSEHGGAAIEVIDQGPGVAASERERIWEPFVRGDSAATRAAGGSGIGLHLVRELVRGMDGSAMVDNAPGGGARFTIRLPPGEPAPAPGS